MTTGDTSTCCRCSLQYSRKPSSFYVQTRVTIRPDTILRGQASIGTALSDYKSLHNAEILCFHVTCRDV